MCDLCPPPPDLSKTITTTGANPSERIDAAREFYNQRLENTDDLMRTVDLMADYADHRTAELREVLREARKTIVDLADQQAIDDDFYKGTLKQIDQALGGKNDE